MFYTFSAYYMVGNPSKANVMEAAAILMFGCVSILLNYMTDVQKEKFRASNGQCYIWGRPAKFLVSFKINILVVPQKIIINNTQRESIFFYIYHFSYLGCWIQESRRKNSKIPFNAQRILGSCSTHELCFWNHVSIFLESSCDSLRHDSILLCIFPHNIISSSYL